MYRKRLCRLCGVRGGLLPILHVFRRLCLWGNRCGSLYDDIFALRGWKREELGGIEFELNSILVEKWKGKANTPIAASLQMTTSLVGKGLTEVFRSLFDTYTKKPSG